MFLIPLLISGGDLPADGEGVRVRPAPITHEQLATLAADSAWLKLLHYSAPDLGIGQPRSDILSTDFFLAETGAVDPMAELVATLAAMQAAPGDDPDAHAQCRFPARYIWLKTNALADSELPGIACPGFRKWLGERPVTGASLIFASGHLGNPSTFYGHMMLRLNSGGEREDRDQLLGAALNHGAVYPENENGIAYIWNGLMGGYKATFSNLAFFNHEHRWNQEQLRDVWEYELDLDPSQVELLAAHSWEVREAYVPYFFLKQNCAFRIAELVSVVLDGSILPSDKPWVMPVDVLDVAQAAQNNGRPLVKDVRILPSRQTTFREKYTALDPNERQLVRDFVRDKPADIEAAVAPVPKERQAAVLESLVDYFSIDNAKDNAEEADKETRNALLLARMSRPAGSTHPEQQERDPPHKGNKASLVQASVIDNSERGEMLQLRFRGAYNDFLSQTPGSLPYSELSIADIRVDIAEGETTLRSAEVVRITTLSLSETGLPDDGGIAWRMRFGAEQDRLSCSDCLVGYVEGGVGRAAYLGSGLVGYGFLNGRAITEDQPDGVAQAGLSAGLITDPSQFARGRVEVGAWQDFDGDSRTRSYAVAEARFGSSSNWDVTATARFENDGFSDTTELQVGVSLYW